MSEKSNSVEILGYYGSDTIIACSAWTSTSRELTNDKVDRIPKLINDLWKNGHHTPFEKGMVHFLVDTDIATHAQFLKHRISSFNGESARYKELKEDKYIIPEDWGDVEVKEELYFNFIDNFELHLNGNRWSHILREYTELGNKLYHKCLADLTPELGRKRAKESARFFKTYNSQIQGDVMFNMRSFHNFLKLRTSEQAQVEIREVADSMLCQVQSIEGNPFKHTLEAWGF